MKSLSIGQHFHHYKYMGANLRHSRVSNTEVNSLIWPKFELIRAFMAIMSTCKFDEDPIKLQALSIGQDQIWAFSALKGK